MGLLFGERRQAFPEPWVPAPGQGSIGMGVRSTSLRRAEAALQKVAIWQSVDMIASLSGELAEAGGVFRGLGRDRVQITTPGWLTDPGGEGHGLADWVWQVMYCWCLRGNTIGKVLERQSSGQPAVIDIQHPDDVSPRQTGSDVEWRINGAIVPTSQIWHRRMYPIPGRVLGLSPIAMHATTIQQGLYAQNFGAQWFLDGAHPSAILQNNSADTIDDTTARTVKQRFIAAIRGTREPVVLGKGWEYKAIQIAPGESQFLEVQGYTSAECARIYGPGMAEILGYETGNTMTYANIEQRSIDLLKYTLNRWFLRAERLLSELLPKPQYYQFDRDMLLQTDTLTRYQAYQYALKNAFLVVNDVHDREGMPHVPWGDAPYLPALGPAAAAAAMNDNTLGPDQKQPAEPAAPPKPTPTLQIVPKKAAPKGGTQ